VARSPPPAKDLNAVCQDMRKQLDEDYSLDADDARDLFVQIWTALIAQETTRTLAEAIARVVTAFDIT
jgi:hypothetical protein